ncbi:Gfo/Idh/MocA family protein [Blastopirellula marina]|uniref:Gfo/Idh/MocA family oxidoreductase n=1 Tax=Blastopirellula marina TaxID=124 RepID=A0A2S8GEF3_9BACT|nr:Gfo/Idh/MocA family oxidoreductase [Blastopirellula marina]PQO42474.1 gfo/Idh/MocA family oxidoreductase [Blastopirellula marina]
MAEQKQQQRSNSTPTEPDRSERTIAAPELPYRPSDPPGYRPKIGLIGCGGITGQHLDAYRNAKYDIAALCDVVLANAEKRQAEYFPKADVYDDYRKLLARDDIEVVDITTHPDVRPPLIEAALEAGKHVLSQKPFVLDLDEGERLVELATKKQRLLAVNQNARWAPHFSYAREAYQAGLLGQLHGVHMAKRWDHRWVEGTPFEKIKHLILYDFAIHWFDFVNYLLDKEKPLRVFATTTRTRDQKLMPALSASVTILYPHTQVTLSFDAATPFGEQDETYLAGSQGSLRSTGPDERNQAVTLFTTEGIAQPKLEGCWFPDGFHGSMGELLSAIAEGREATNSGAQNLTGLATCFAAIHSAETGEVVVPGDVRSLRKSSR